MLETGRRVTQDILPPFNLILESAGSGKLMKLFCAIVGVMESAFSEKIDDRSVDDLKKCIKEENNDLKAIDADKLELYLVRTESCVWLTEADMQNGVNDTIGLKPLDVAGAPLKMVELSEATTYGTSNAKTIEEVNWFHSL